MKPFNLEEYLKDPSKKVVTRAGRKVRIICTDRLDERYPICALIKLDRGEEYRSYTTGGKFLEGEIDEENDLFFATKKKEGWINIYNDYVSHSTSTVYQTKEDAEKRGKDSKYYVTTIKIEWEE